MATNVEYAVKAGKLIITVDISKAACDKSKPSSTGKTNLVASTHGAEKIEGPDGWAVTFSLNVSGKRE